MSWILRVETSLPYYIKRATAGARARPPARSPALSRIYQRRDGASSASCRPAAAPIIWAPRHKRKGATSLQCDTIVVQITSYILFLPTHWQSTIKKRTHNIQFKIMSYFRYFNFSLFEPRQKIIFSTEESALTLFSTSAFAVLPLDPPVPRRPPHPRHAANSASGTPSTEL